MNLNQEEWELAISELKRENSKVTNRMAELPLELLDLIRGGSGDRVRAPDARPYD